MPCCVYQKQSSSISLQREWALHGHQRYSGSKDQRIQYQDWSTTWAFQSALPGPILCHEDQIDQLPENIKQEVRCLIMIK
jgi:hypothetical protein